MAKWKIAISFLFLLFFLTFTNLLYAKTIEVRPGEIIQDAINNQAVSGDTVFVYAGTYYEDIFMKDGVSLIGELSSRVTIKGKVFFKDATSTLKDVTVLFPESNLLSYSNDYYLDWKLESDAGIIAINSAPIIQYCVIQPDLDFINSSGGYNPPLEYYGKAIQIWNLYRSDNTGPFIENNLILDAEIGIYLFSQAFGGVILGQIKNNTFYHNKNGIILRMHKEKPEIRNNIIAGGYVGLFLTYRDGLLFDERKELIHHNDIWDAIYKYWLDAETLEFDLTGINGNISEDPLFVDPASFDFSLDIRSPCRGRADDGGDMGAQIDLASRLSISLDPATWFLDSIPAGSSRIASRNERIIILNDGSVRESFDLQVIDSAGTWRASDTVGGNDMNRYVLSGIFTGLEILEVNNSNFNELGNEDLILDTSSQVSTDTKFAATVSSENGVRVMPDEERALWLKFDAPKADNTQVQHDIRVIINAELSE